MKTKNFEKLIQALTGRDLHLNTDDKNLIPGKKYTVYRKLPISGIVISFNFICPKNKESIIKSFINNYVKKYTEPDPEKYNKTYGGIVYRWNDKSDEDKEYAYLHHRNNMFNPEKLRNQIKENLNTKGIENTLCKYGFYQTHYGIGIFILFSTVYELIAINKMKEYLTNKNIHYNNEFSDAKWVYRFILNIDKDSHKRILNDFNNLY